MASVLVGLIVLAAVVAEVLLGVACGHVLRRRGPDDAGARREQLSRRG